MHYFAEHLLAIPKGSKNSPKEIVRLCPFVNVSTPLDNNHWNRNSICSTAQQLYFFDAPKQNAAIPKLHSFVSATFP